MHPSYIINVLDKKKPLSVDAEFNVDDWQYDMIHPYALHFVFQQHVITQERQRQ